MFPLFVFEEPEKPKRSAEPAQQTPLAVIEAELAAADLILINSSGGKDSQTALEEVVRTARRLCIPKHKLVVVHADLGVVEWPGTRELAQEQAKHYGLRFEVVRHKNANGESHDLLEHILKRGMWPDSQARFCTSDFERGPVQTLMTRYAQAAGRRHRLKPGQKKYRVVSCLGMRAEESDARNLLPNWTLNTSASNGLRDVFNWLPIFKLTKDEVWARIRASGVQHHWAYDLGMPRLSCCFCIFSPKSALILAGKHNRELLLRYVAAEQKMKHTFRHGFSLAEVLAAVDANQQPGPVLDWAK
ncbi:MAG: phosphoadenosine phosphosulfate reductase family protein [Planctomycetes bacterium]|nr:phosphoadenosine phosphosulfate reductase family protein [Planctomycetota bacterium]